MDLTPLIRQCTSLFPTPGAWSVLMDAFEQLETPPNEWWGLLVDYIEESGQVPSDTWVRILDQMTDQEIRTKIRTTDPLYVHRRDAYAVAIRELFHGLAQSSYEYAVSIFVEWSRDEDKVFKQIASTTAGYSGAAHYNLKTQAVDGMNSAHCHGGENWEKDLSREKMEWLVAEVGNFETKPLKYQVVERIEPDTGDEGVSRTHAERAVRDDEAELIEDDRLGDLLVRRYNGERFWWLAFAPEWQQHDLEREYPDAQFLTVYGGESSHELLLIDDEVWERVYDGAHTPETECPNADQEHLDERGDREGVQGEVVLSDTYCGEQPGAECRYCGEGIGQEHGVIYMGEGAEAVYAHTPAEEEDD